MESNLQTNEVGEKNVQGCALCSNHLESQDTFNLCHQFHFLCLFDWLGKTKCALHCPTCGKMPTFGKECEFNFYCDFYKHHTSLTKSIENLGKKIDFHISLPSTEHAHEIMLLKGEKSDLKAQYERTITTLKDQISELNGEKELENKKWENKLRLDQITTEQLMNSQKSAQRNFNHAVGSAVFFGVTTAVLATKLYLSNQKQ